MKKSPQLQRLEKMLRASKISSCGFLGIDQRSLDEIIEADAAEIARLDKTNEQIAGRMRELTAAAKTGLGDWIKVTEYLEVSIDDSRGRIPCPWSHGVRCSKMITTCRRLDTKVSVRWSELNMHMIEAHGIPLEMFKIIRYMSRRIYLLYF
ncbi:hypothetical protein A2Y85_02220 [candidate division WOR-3 bacterium RBG_13_43_14]|uniref:Uncharacterized protein n=1 Tax=candidate division WOR-3 bacterium RBG_13_43_14 TaxID=1802590 RepID=A0A1F4UDG8_UNCW3|nr:MAG: hypothetical protein A2Y85_02220 [candidate division WOR-3 bacterium RBG_13_43_14]